MFAGSSPIGESHQGLADAARQLAGSLAAIVTEGQGTWRSCARRGVATSRSPPGRWFMGWLADRGAAHPRGEDNAAFVSVPVGMHSLLIDGLRAAALKAVDQNPGRRSTQVIRILNASR
jgi:hypothetical protein